MSDGCCASGSNIMILACSGGSNVGQLSNQAAVELTQEGFGKMFCLAGIGGQLSGFVQSAHDIPRMVAIDGCSIGCARACLENSNVPLKTYLVLTDLGFEKNKGWNSNRNKSLRRPADSPRRLRDTLSGAPSALRGIHRQGVRNRNDILLLGVVCNLSYEVREAVRKALLPQ